MGKKKETESISAEFIAEQCIAVRLRLLTRAVTKLYNKALRPFGITISQMNILVAVSCFGEAKQQDVCQALHLDKSTLSRDVERMRAQGWLDALPGEDARSHALRLTAGGKKLLQKVIPAWQEAQGQASALLGQRQVAALNSATRTFRAMK